MLRLFFKGQFPCLENGLYQESPDFGVGIAIAVETMKADSDTDADRDTRMP
jgi:hypothetical protein